MNQQEKTNGARTVTKDASHLDRVVNATTAKMQATDAYLRKGLPTIEEVLPPFLKGQGGRLIKRAMMVKQANKDLADMTDADLYRCVLESASVGIQIDGVRGYIVRYKQRYQFQAHYAAVVAALRRHGVIKDCYADVVCEGDNFTAFRENGKSHLRHEYGLSDTRGKVVGAYAVVILPDFSWRYELMSLAELNAIQLRAPSKNGPWSTDVNEMRKKTVIRRLIKLYVDDVGILDAMADPWEDDQTTQIEVSQLPIGRASLRTPPPVEAEEPPTLAEGELRQEQMELQRQDVATEIMNAIAAADTAKEMEGVGAMLQEASDFLGTDLHAKLLAQFQAKYRNLAGLK